MFEVIISLFKILDGLSSFNILWNQHKAEVRLLSDLICGIWHFSEIRSQSSNLLFTISALPSAIYILRKIRSQVWHSIFGISDFEYSKNNISSARIGKAKVYLLYPSVSDSTLSSRINEKTNWQPIRTIHSSEYMRSHHMQEKEGEGIW